MQILLINDIPIVETPDEIMKLQDEMAGKQNIGSLIAFIVCIVNELLESRC